ncbi:ABC transporter permease [Prolixibacter bellariivorans]|uniref:ABC transporter permease n=1 Tax=Prolixibacter bellariivorans TaxID=314319 RepID=A0A5M4B0W5_9BACT|nr:FtsX-like permease family protein [Prolixibacter bellariivorans]GET33802.1 ABC transporter permease [Prolixibacter bellariivorans]
MMTKNYIKLAIRNLRRNKDYFFINTFGLAIGMACAILVMLHVWTQTHFDDFHPDDDRLYRVIIESKMGSIGTNFAVTSPKFAFGLKKRVPEIEQACRVSKSERKILLKTQNGEILNAPSLLFVDSTFFDMFGFKLLQGNPATCLSKEKSIVIPESMAKTYYPEGAIGKKIISENDTEWTITGVVQDCPYNTHMQYSALVSLSTLELPDNSWLTSFLYTYYRFKPGVDMNKPAPQNDIGGVTNIEMKLQSAFLDAATPEIEQNTKMTPQEFHNMGNNFVIKLQQIRRIHLFSHLNYEMSKNANIETLIVLGAISLLIILIAAINYANLSTARLAGRTREIGIRKLLGSHRRDMARQFLAESITISFISLFLALVIVELAFPQLEKMYQFSSPSLSQSLLKLSPIIFGIALITGILAGLYPAFYVTRFTPATILQNQKKLGPRAKGLRGVLVILQFLFSIVIIYSTSTIYRQLNFIQSKSIGFDKNNLLVLDNSTGLGDNRAQFTERIKDLPHVTDLSYSSSVPGQLIDMYTFHKTNDSTNQNYLLQVNWADNHFLKTYGMHFIDSTKSIPGESAEPKQPISHSNDTLRHKNSKQVAQPINVVVNEKAVQYMGLKNPVGAHLIRLLQNGDQVEYTIKGVVRNFHFESFHEEVQPMVFLPEVPRFSRFTSIRFSSPPTDKDIAQVQKIWEEENPTTLFSEFSMSDNLQKQYTEERSTGEVAVAFSFFAIFIACMGLYSLMALITVYRTKEIGIRKVLGAGTRELVFLLSKETLQLVILASLLALPLAYQISRLWLSRFAYQVNLSVTNYLFVSAAVFAIAIFTVYRQLWRTINADPAESLRYE